MKKNDKESSVLSIEHFLSYKLHNVLLDARIPGSATLSTSASQSLFPMSMTIFYPGTEK